MTDTRVLANLVEARARTSTLFDTYRGVIQVRPGKNYVMLLFGAGAGYSDTLVGTATMLAWNFRALCVGFSDGDCLFVADRIRDLFSNWRPIPDSMASSWFTELRDEAPVLRDESMVNDVRWSLTLRFQLTTPRST